MSPRTANVERQVSGWNLTDLLLCAERLLTARSRHPRSSAVGSADHPVRKFKLRHYRGLRCPGQPGGLTYAKAPDGASSFSQRGKGLRSRTGLAATRGWDYVVVGAGAAGCVVAGRLAQTMPDVRIALIEAGGARLGLTTKIPGTAFIASTSPRRNWNFETEPVPALNGRKLWWFQGRILGGSGSINGMLYLRGLARIRPVGAARVPGVVLRPSAALLQESRNQYPGRQ